MWVPQGCSECKSVKRGSHKGVLDVKGLSVGTTRVL